VDQSAVARTEHRLSLTDDDVSAIQTSLTDLLGRWLLVTETGEEGEYYGRLLPPWGDSQRSAFLLEREDDLIILTDNLSKWDRCDVTRFPSAAQAMQAVHRVVHGST
jgi:hypothetical protein